uniref:Inactive dipeptidyl peptidase 10-like n=1 Tax=Cyprinodon variegatus TaxID=28743 RepID=A0A3Q2CQY5_CYPVA
MIATTQQNMTTELDLGSSDGPPRNWKGIGIAMVVILGVMSLVILSVVILTPDSHLLLRSHVTMEDLESEEFKVHDPCAAWLNNEVVLHTREGHVLTFALNSNQTTTLLDNSSLLQDLTSTKFQVSADKKFVLLAYNIRPVFSQSFTASYAIYSVANDLLEVRPPGSETTELQFASWGPQGNQLAFVFDGDIYYKPSVPSNPLRLTSTEEDQNVVNGLSDWTYEEVLLTYAAHWWSMDGARLAYLRINNSATPVMEIPHFLGGLYPSNMIFHYPKSQAGSSIPSVSLFVVNLYGPAHTLEMLPPDENYISMVSWISSTRLVVRWLNRAQNQSVLCVCEATTGACSEQDVPLFTSDGSMFYTVLPAKQGARGEFHHIAGLTVQQPAIPSVPPRFLTSGSWDVTLLCALDEEAGRFFLSTEESRESRHLYVDLNGVFQRRCISCDLVDGCNFFKVVFSPNQTHFILYCLPRIPKVTVHSTKDPSYVILEDNNPLSEALEDKRLPESLFKTVQADNHLPQGYEANLLPLLIIDGTPGSQTVTEEFSLGWPQVLCSAHNVALAWVDGRSGVGRGQKTVAVDPRKLGSLRVKDYLGVVLLMQLPYIDDRRIALFGKALGGYLTLKMLAATDKLFQCAAAAAPITDFKLYAAFSERYLGLPAKEDHAYLTASVLEEANKLKEENFLILHGTADRVHFQHSAELLSRLVKVEANYSLQLYPDEGHVLREPRSVRHFQRTVVNYLQNCLKHSTLLEVPEEEEEEDD